MRFQLPQLARHLLHATLFALAVLTSFSSKCEEPPSAQKADPAALVNKGRALFAQSKYAEAHKVFESALDQNPSSKETRFLAALAAFWARKPERALAYWNHLIELAARGSNDEWEIQKNRVITLAALGQHEAADLAVDRLREIRTAGKSSAATAAKGFTREHFFGRHMRAGCWETFDERGDAPALWSLTVIVDADPTPPPHVPAKNGDTASAPPTQEPPEEKTIATIAVEIAALPAGGTGYVFSEETADARRVYKRWAQRPAYSEVRALIVAALAGNAQPIEEKAIKPPPAAMVMDDDEPVPLEIKNMRLDPQAETIVFTAWKLKRVRADVTKLARITPGDDAALDEYMQEFNTKYPHAAVTAGELSELITKAKADCVLRACEKLVKLTNRSPYLEFALLTALSARDRDIPDAPLHTFSKSSDFLVRITAALLYARHGHMIGVEMLFTELESADARGCELIMGSLYELLGHVIDAPPDSKRADAAQKLTEWKQLAARWSKANLELLEFTKSPKPGQPNWAKP